MVELTVYFPVVHELHIPQEKVTIIDFISVVIEALGYAMKKKALRRS
jgi:hypothetical protein